MVRTKVFVGNLAFSTKEPELAAEFAAAGKVISANIITRGPRSLGYGFVELDSEEDAQKAVTLLNKKEINGRQINVEVAKPQDETRERKPRQPKAQSTDENGTAEAKPTGRRRSSYRRRQPVSEDKTDAHPSEETNEEDRPRKPRSRRTRGRRTNERSQGEPAEKKEESKTTLFVANLPFSLDDEAFAKIITDLNNLKLKSAHVVKKRNGRSKGYGFVEFETEEDQQKALNSLNKKVVDERELSVKIALTENRREETGKTEEEKKEVKKETKPAEKKAVPVPTEKKATPAEKKAVPVEKKAVPVEKKAVPVEKKATPEKKAPETQEEAKKADK